MRVHFFKPRFNETEIERVVACLRSGWLTTGVQTRRFEQEFARAVGARHAVAVNSCTAALHLAAGALGLQANQAVLVPAMTFAATAEIVRYCGAIPVLVDCDPETLNMDLADARKKLDDLAAGRVPGAGANVEAAGIIAVHVGGNMLDMDAVQAFASEHGLWLIEDAAHAFPAAWRRNSASAWVRCGENTSAVACFSFYANKTITTGEGGMAVTDDKGLADRMRLMSLHGLSHDAWERYSGSGKWDYQIVEAGYKYNLTDIASALGLGQLERAEDMRAARERIALAYLSGFADVDTFDPPPVSADRIHSWHLFPIRLRLDRLAINRNQFLEALHQAGVGTSVHWRPLHLHPYYEQLGWTAESCPVASRVWETLISLPVWPSQSDEEIRFVIDAVRDVAATHRVRSALYASAGGTM